MTVFALLRADRRGWPWLALPLLALLGLLLPSYRDISLGLWRQEQNAYLPGLSALALWLLCYRGRDLVPAPAARPPLSGIGLLLSGQAGHVLGRWQRIELIELAGLVPVLAGMVLILGGRTALRQLRFALLFPLFALPFPGSVVDSLTHPLREWISHGCASLLHLAGYPVARSGVVLTLWPYRLLVADACSGLHSLIFLAALGLLYLHLTGRRARWHWAALVLALLPIAVLANLIRVLALLLITYHLGDATGQGDWHEAAGVLLFASAFLLLIGLDGLLGRFEAWRAVRQQAEPAQALPSGHLPGWQPGMTVTLLLLAAWAGLALTPRQPNGQRAALNLQQLIPDRLGDWRRDELAERFLVTADVKGQEWKPYNQELSRTYVNGQGRRVMLVIAYGRDQLGSLLQVHRPEACFRAQGFSLSEQHDAELALPGGDRPLQVRRLVARLDQRIEPISYWMAVGGEATLPGLQRKLVQLRYGLRGQIPDGALVRVSSLTRQPAADFALHARFIADLQRSLPGQLGLPAAASASERHDPPQPRQSR